MRVYVGVDVGYGYTKIYAGRSLRFKFPSLVSADTGELLDKTNVVRFNGSEFVVGIGSKDLRSDDFPFREEYRALLYYAIAHLLEKTHAKEVVVGLGVPPVFRSKREEIRKKLAKKVEVEVSGKKYSFLLKPVVFLQGWGGYIDHIYTLEGRYVKENDVPAIYSDWGYYTVDTIVTRRVWTAEGERVIPSLPEHESPTIKKGVSSLYQLYSRLVADKEGLVVPDLRTAEKMFLQNRYPHLIKKAVEIWKREVLDEILSRYRESAHQIEKIVVFGGGANFIEEDLRVEDYPVIKLDEYANARGYFKALPSALKREVQK